MKMIQYIKHTLFILVCVLFAGGLVSCSDDNEDLLPNQGQVNFQLTRHKVYLLSNLETVSTIIVTLEKDGEKFILPSLEMAGNEDLLTSSTTVLTEGEYLLVSYKAFGFDGNLLLEQELDDAMEVSVIAGVEQSFVLPVNIKVIITTNNIRNVVYAIATDAIGEDRTKWPASWDENESLTTWEGLEFEVDDYGNPLYITGIVIDGNQYSDFEFNNELTERKHGLPEFKNMKRLSSAIVNLNTLTSLVIRNCDLEELPANMFESNLQSIQIENTNLAKLPESMGRMPNLYSFALRGNRFTEVPACISEMSHLQMLEISENGLTSLPESLGKLKALNALRVRNTQITSVPDIFLNTQINMLDLWGNKNLNTLPASVGVDYMEELGHRNALHGLILDDCGFTEIPRQAVRSGITTLTLSNNSLTRVTADDINAMTDLESLSLAGNAFSSFPVINNASLRMLDLRNCGLVRSQIETSGMPSLKSNWLILTQQEYDDVLTGYTPR